MATTLSPKPKHLASEQPEKERYPEDLLKLLREMTVVEVLRIFDVYFKDDASFRAVQSKSTRRIHVSIDDKIIELVYTGPKWFDKAADKGGGGIDLTMHLFNLPFSLAVRKLSDSIGNK